RDREVEVPVRLPRGRVQAREEVRGLAVDGPERPAGQHRPLNYARGNTISGAACPKAVGSVAVDVLTSEMFFADTTPTVVNTTPMYGFAQVGSKVIVLTRPLTFGFEEEMAPVAWSKLKTLLRVTALCPGCPTFVNVPTAYIREPH